MSASLALRVLRGLSAAFSRPSRGRRGSLLSAAPRGSLAPRLPQSVSLRGFFLRPCPAHPVRGRPPFAGVAGWLRFALSRLPAAARCAASAGGRGAAVVLRGRALRRLARLFPAPLSGFSCRPARPRPLLLPFFALLLPRGRAKRAPASIYPLKILKNDLTKNCRFMAASGHLTATFL